MTTFTVMSGERCGVPLLSRGYFCTEAHAIDLARALVLFWGSRVRPRLA